jgi:hypothetical protein
MSAAKSLLLFFYTWQELLLTLKQVIRPNVGAKILICYGFRSFQNNISILPKYYVLLNPNAKNMFFAQKKEQQKCLDYEYRL